MNKKQMMIATLLSMAMIGCVNDEVDEHEDHLEPYGLLLVNGSDTLRFYNADADHGIVERSDTLKIANGKSMKWSVLLATPDGVEVPDTTDADHVFAVKSVTSPLKLSAGNWTLLADANAVGQGQLELQILHGGHVDFVLAKPIRVEVQ